MSRCAICDEVSQKVIWRAKHNEFQCQPCYESIRDTVKDWETDEIDQRTHSFPDFITSIDDTDDILEDTPTVSEMPVE